LVADGLPLLQYERHQIYHRPLAKPTPGEMLHYPPVRAARRLVHWRGRSIPSPFFDPEIDLGAQRLEVEVILPPPTAEKELPRGRE
jgi:hypothetical protein